MLSCRFEDGGTAELRHVVVHAICVRDDQVLLVKRAAHLSEANLYAFPGGYVDRNETIAGAVQREVLEETGYECVVGSLFSICDNPDRPKEDRQNIAFSYIVTITEHRQEPDSESSEVKWISLQDLPSKEFWAFDHYEHFCKYLDWRKGQNSQLPLMVST